MSTTAPKRTMRRMAEGYVSRLFRAKELIEPWQQNYDILIATLPRQSISATALT
jgi:hypothetical protein